MGRGVCSVCSAESSYQEGDPQETRWTGDLGASFLGSTLQEGRGWWKGSLKQQGRVLGVAGAPRPTHLHGAPSPPVRRWVWGCALDCGQLLASVQRLPTLAQPGLAAAARGHRGRGPGRGARLSRQTAGLLTVSRETDPPSRALSPLIAQIRRALSAAPPPDRPQVRVASLFLPRTPRTPCTASEHRRVCERVFRLGATSVCALCVHMYVSAYLCAQVCVCVSVCVREQTLGGGPGVGGGCLQAFGEPGAKAPASEPFFRLEGLGTEACSRAGPGTDLKNFPPHQRDFPPHPRAGQVPLTTPALPAPSPPPALPRCGRWAGLWS